jgi:hypothetical protein
MASSTFNAILQGCGVQHLTKHAGVYFKEITHMRLSVVSLRKPQQQLLYCPTNLNHCSGKYTFDNIVSFRVST